MLTQRNVLIVVDQIARDGIAQLKINSFHSKPPSFSLTILTYQFCFYNRIFKKSREIMLKNRLKIDGFENEKITVAN